jgi:hypothetical protein
MPVLPHGGSYASAGHTLDGQRPAWHLAGYTKREAL